MACRAFLLVVLCTSNLLKVSQSALLGDTCNTDDPCDVSFSYCDEDESKCICDNEYFSIDEDKNTCFKRTGILGGDCTTTAQCGNINQAECENSVCQCSATYVAYSGRCIQRIPTLESGVCEVSSQCPANSRCTIGQSGSGKQCVCQRGFVKNGQSDACLPVVTEIGSDCKENIQCTQETENTVCGLNDDGKSVCLCSENYVFDTEELVCKKRTVAENGQCFIQEQCDGINAECTGSLCRCKTGETAFNRAKGYCEPLSLMKRCFNDEHCSALQNSLCKVVNGDEKQCVCKDGHVVAADSRRCLPVIPNFNGRCEEKTQCSLPNTDCLGGPGPKVCTCATGYIRSVDGTSCVKLAEFVNDPCQLNGHCVRVASSICDTTTKRCTCPATHVAKQDLKICLKKTSDFTSECGQLNQCSEVNAHCDMLGKNCACNENYVEVNNVCGKVAESLNEACTVNSQCPFEKSECREGTCKCIAPYKADLLNKKCNSGAVNNLAIAALMFSIILSLLA